MGLTKQFNLKIKHLSDVAEIATFECGVPQMDKFLHTTFIDSVENHYCNAYTVTDGEEIVAVFALSFDSLELDDDDIEEMIEGISSTSLPDVTPQYLDVFKCKRHYPAMEITYLAVSEKYRGNHIGSAIIRVIANKAKEQDLAGCQFLTVEALKTEPYSAVGFYYKCHFAPCEMPNANKDTLRMFFTLFPAG